MTFLDDYIEQQKERANDYSFQMHAHTIYIQQLLEIIERQYEYIKGSAPVPGLTACVKDCERIAARNEH